MWLVQLDGREEYFNVRDLRKDTHEAAVQDHVVFKEASPEEPIILSKPHIEKLEEVLEFVRKTRPLAQDWNEHILTKANGFVNRECVDRSITCGNSRDAVNYSMLGGNSVPAAAQKYFDECEPTCRGCKQIVKREETKLLACPRIVDDPSVSGEFKTRPCGYTVDGNRLNQWWKPPRISYELPDDLFEEGNRKSVLMAGGDNIVLLNIMAFYTFGDKCTRDHVFQIVLTASTCYMMQSCKKMPPWNPAGFNLTKFWEAEITSEGDHCLKSPNSFRVSKTLVDRLVSEVTSGDLSGDMHQVIFGAERPETSAKLLKCIITKDTCANLDRFRNIMDLKKVKSIANDGDEFYSNWAYGKYPGKMNVASSGRLANPAVWL